MARRTGHHATTFLGNHSRSITAAVVVVLAGFGATAFGIAPMVAQEPVDLTTRIISENVVPDDISSQLEALAAHRVSLYRSELTRSGDTVDSLLKRLGIVDAEAAAFLRDDATARQMFTGRTGKMVQARIDEQGRFEELVVRYAPEDSALIGSHFTRLTVSRVAEQPAQFETKVEVAELQIRQRLGSGTIRHSLFAAADDARVPDVVASQIAEIFSADIDFRRQLRRGDTFSVVYEALLADGELINWNQGAGRVLAAEFVNDGTVHSAVWFADPAASGSAARGAYYDMNGQNKRRSFLASPLEFSRVTSGFSMRLHPILRTWRQHKGVDYGAPTGTPVRTVGDGVIEFAGSQGGYGNVVKVRHTNNRVTVYAHLSRVNVRRGERVEQGDTIGAVGSTGWATGPHLHFEFIVGGDHIDPMIVARSSETNEITARTRPVFDRLISGIRTQLTLAQTASRQTEYAE
ncbi:M23 family metallopeptidase [Piscinibacter sakaiensis]|uniref:M23 family metallopeptidase n=1 Tax=Piscinibacter sakaiensis TaxID=1547922 RepID=UPI003AACD150